MVPGSRNFSYINRKICMFLSHIIPSTITTYHLSILLYSRCKGLCYSNVKRIWFCNLYFNRMGLCDVIFYALGFSIECTDVFNFAIHISSALDFVMEFWMHWVDPLY